MRERGPGKGERSFLTLMVYLDTPGEGGETNFLNMSEGTQTSVHPTSGLGLCFEHDIVHEGATLRSGVKHALRTDIMFRRASRLPMRFASHEEMLGIKR